MFSNGGRLVPTIFKDPSRVCRQITSLAALAGWGFGLRGGARHSRRFQPHHRVSKYTATGELLRKNGDERSTDKRLSAVSPIDPNHPPRTVGAHSTSSPDIAEEDFHNARQGATASSR